MRRGDKTGWGERRREEEWRREEERRRREGNVDGDGRSSVS